MPTDVVKIRAQLKKTTAPQALRELLRRDGPGVLLHGGRATFAHLTLSQAIFFATYEYVLERSGPGAPAYAPAVAGAVAGCAEWTLCMATDSVKTRYQAGAVGASYAGVWRSVWRTEGLRGFYRGYPAAILRAVPVNASTFFIIERINAALADHLRPDRPDAPPKSRSRDA